MTDISQEQCSDIKLTCCARVTEDKLDSEDASLGEVTSVSKKPSRISDHVRDRFRSLQTRADNLTKRSTEKRIKHLQKQILDTVKEKLNTEEEREILQKHRMELDSAPFKVPAKDKPEVIKSSRTSEAKQAASEDYQQQIKQYLGINDHLRAEGSGSQGPRTGLEREMDQAVARGQLRKAEELSDRLATRDFAVKITEAADAREFLKRKKEEEDYIKSKKKKKLNWGFDHKQRWETKGNM